MSFAKPRTRRAVARELRAARIAAGMTTRELAEHIGCTELRLSAIERAERSVSIEELILIARVLRVDLRRLIARIVG
jgi:transcriptional regulator with XRE-family HTH domain